MGRGKHLSAPCKSPTRDRVLRLKYLVKGRILWIYSHYMWPGGQEVGSSIYIIAERLPAFSCLSKAMHWINEVHRPLELSRRSMQRNVSHDAGIIDKARSTRQKSASSVFRAPSSTFLQGLDASETCLSLGPSPSLIRFLFTLWHSWQLEGHLWNPYIFPLTSVRYL